jgi:hypothetical protein
VFAEKILKNRCKFRTPDIAHFFRENQGFSSRTCGRILEGFFGNFFEASRVSLS